MTTYKTATGITLTVIQGFKGLDSIPLTDALETLRIELRDKSMALSDALNSERKAWWDAMTVKEIPKYLLTESKDHATRLKSVPKRLQAQYSRIESIRLELVAIQEQHRDVLTQLDNMRKVG